MRRDNLTVDVRPPGDDGDSPPALAIASTDGADTLPEALTRRGAKSLGPDDVDVALRRTDDDTGVLSIARRLTGEFLLEANVRTAAIDELVTAARRGAEDTRYLLVFDSDRSDPAAERTLQKRTLLVYDAHGNLDRDTSLIPSGVEL